MTFPFYLHPYHVYKEIKQCILREQKYLSFIMFTKKVILKDWTGSNTPTQKEWINEDMEMSKLGEM